MCATAIPRSTSPFITQTTAPCSGNIQCWRKNLCSWIQRRPQWIDSLSWPVNDQRWNFFTFGVRGHPQRGRRNDGFTSESLVPQPAVFDSDQNAQRWQRGPTRTFTLSIRRWNVRFRCFHSRYISGNFRVGYPADCNWTLCSLGETETNGWQGQVSTTESGIEEASWEALKDETEYRFRHFSAGVTSLNQSTARARWVTVRSQGTGSVSESATNRHHSGSDPSSVTHRQLQSGSPGPMSSSPESRGQRVSFWVESIQSLNNWIVCSFKQMLKRLSYPLVWMGKSLSSEPRESPPPPVTLASSESSNQEYVFSKVFSRYTPDKAIRF